MSIFRRSRNLKSRVTHYIFFFLCLMLLLFLNCLKMSEQSKSNRIFENYIRYYIDHDFEFQTLHRFTENLVQLAPADFNHYTQALHFFENEITALDTVKLSPENQIDFVLLKRHLGRQRFLYEKRKNWQHDPEWYGSLAGNSFYWPTVVASVPPEAVASILIARLKQLPRFLEQARANLVSTTSRKIALAQRQSAALESFLARKMTQLAAERPEFSDSLKLYQSPALDALKSWHDFLENDLQRADREALTGSVFAEWMSLTMGDDFCLTEMRTICEGELKLLPGQMQLTSREIYRKYFSSAKYQRAAASENGFDFSAALEKVQTDFLKSEAVLPFIQEVTGESERFLQFKNLMKVRNSGSKHFDLLPEFLAGEPFVKTISREKQHHFLIRLQETEWRWSEMLDFSKYLNRNRLRLIALGQIIPGKILQFEYADSLGTPVQRYFGDLPMQSGWEIFAPWLMRKSGFTGYDPAFILMEQLDNFQTTLGALLCLKFHLNELDETGVRQVLKDQGFLEGVVLDEFFSIIILRPEQVIARFWGGYLLRQLYEDARSQQQNHFDLIAFNQKILTSGFVPIQSVRRCLLRSKIKRFDTRTSERSFNGEKN